ncbi:MAG: response regulator, partial [Cytophagaceae bacterium]
MARILVIDDAKNIRKMVTLTLQKDGHEVEEAVDGAQGLELFGEGDMCDLTLVDQQMPKSDGRQVVVEARRRAPRARLIMMTAFATSELAGDVLEAGAVDFLRKPFSTTILRGAVENALVRAGQVAKFSALVSRDESEPQINLTINGFDFWSVRPSLLTLPQGIEISRTFYVLVYECLWMCFQTVDA